jgi:hypothetical protein
MLDLQVIVAFFISPCSMHGSGTNLFTIGCDSINSAMCWPQDAMRKAEAAGTEECPVKIKLVAPPLYVLTTQTLDKVGGHKYTFFYVSMALSLSVCFYLS